MGGIKTGLQDLQDSQDHPEHLENLVNPVSGFAESNPVVTIMALHAGFDQTH
jgi:hypothetical protein